MKLIKILIHIYSSDYVSVLIGVSYGIYFDLLLKLIEWKKCLKNNIFDWLLNYDFVKSVFH